MLKFPPKVVGILCVLQVMAIVGTCLIARTMLKLYNSTQLTDDGIRPHRLYLTVSALPYVVPWMLLIPLVWGVVATLRADMEERVPLISESQTKVGYGATLLVLIFCMVAIMRSIQMAFEPSI
ncbi:hypothetical protein [Roseimicrobium sp. ORNL1]|uniref:hypothetical protein n=1 Tax=Roseimicrobium sp. ORNL1 TaxID=2711231 RepID=UPI0013E1D9D0|nr:hypothetical protein [Roseimicrobium sp. ORNL1]QIF00696.1 hypothetical protein G5S37_03895 [Roseimicrobium sp. ORNL1]